MTPKQYVYHLPELDLIALSKYKTLKQMVVYIRIIKAWTEFDVIYIGEL